MEVKAITYFFWIFILVENVAIATDEEVKFERLENEYAIGNESSTTEASKNSTVLEKLDNTESPKSQIKLDSVTEFKPSLHLGEIDQFRNFNNNPFNKPSHLKFENFFSVLPKAEGLHTVSSINKEANNFDNKINNNYINSSPTETNFFPKSGYNENQNLRSPDNAVSFPQTLSTFQSQNFPTTFQNSQPLSPSLQNSEYSLSNFPDKTFFENTFVNKDTPELFEHPVPIRDDVNFLKSYSGVQNFKYPKPSNFENYEEQNIVKVHPEIIKLSSTSNHGFPYRFYREPPLYLDSNLEYLEEEQVFHNLPRERRVSPWKKIIHILGTILPFGLLLASLSPKIIQIGNSTQSSIPLSKLKNIDLPPEHKNLRMEDPNFCEDKNICEIILAGSKPKSNLLQNILWNFVSGTAEETAKDNDLRELFQAVKKRDCNLITC